MGHTEVNEVAQAFDRCVEGPFWRERADVKFVDD